MAPAALASLRAQGRGKIAVLVTDEAKNHVASVTLELRRLPDSMLVQTAITNESGQASFMDILPSPYIIRATAVSHQPVLSGVIAGNGDSVFVMLVMKARAAAEMQNVTVAAQRPFIQRLTDRLVVNVENSIINAGSTVLEVLERSPGVIVDQENISIRGRAGLIIMIDGRRTPMSGTDLITYLRNLPAGAVDRIEIITNPSARYDAEGSGGIIDIKLKKDQRLGFNGGIQAGYGQGVYAKGNGGISGNYRNKKLNVFGSYNLSRRKDISTLYQERIFFEQDLQTGSDIKHNDGTVSVTGHSGRLGMDYFFTGKTVAGFVVTTNQTAVGISSSNLSTAVDPQGSPLDYFTTEIRGQNSSRNYVANLNLKHQFSKEMELNLDADLGFYNTDNGSRVITDYFKQNGGSARPRYTLDALQLGDLSLRSAKADYTYHAKGIKWEAGAKSSRVTAENDAQFYHMLPSGPEVDEGKTNRFFYTEYNHAAYLNHSREGKRWSVQLGLRGEYTAVDTRQVVHDVRWDSSYFQLFPSAFVNYKNGEEEVWGISVSRRIDRPGYGMLNPFLSFIDVTAYNTGNPHLLPQRTWSFELTYTHKNQNFGFSYNRTADPHYPVIARILDVIPDFYIEPGSDSNITVQKSMNLQALHHYSLWASTQVKPAAWWNMMNEVNLFINHAQANIGGARLNNGKPTFFLRSGSSFQLKRGWSAESKITVLTARRSGYLVSRTRWGLDAGVQKKILGDRGTIRLNATDIFKTLLPMAIVTFPGRYVEHWDAYRDSRVINLSFSYRFGNTKVQGARNRSTASEEERRRI